jgi:hypothetical protein
VLVRELVRRNPLGETLWSGSGGGREADGGPASDLCGDRGGEPVVIDFAVGAEVLIDFVLPLREVNQGTQGELASCTRKSLLREEGGVRRREW